MMHFSLRPRVGVIFGLLWLGLAALVFFLGPDVALSWPLLGVIAGLLAGVALGRSYLERPAAFLAADSSFVVGELRRTGSWGRVYQILFFGGVLVLALIAWLSPGPRLANAFAFLVAGLTLSGVRDLVTVPALRRLQRLAETGSP